MHRLGGSNAAGGQISREDRLKKLMGSALYNGEIKPVGQKKGSIQPGTEAQGEPGDDENNNTDSNDKENNERVAMNSNPPKEVSGSRSIVAPPQKLKSSSFVTQKPQSHRYGNPSADDAEKRRGISSSSTGSSTGATTSSTGTTSTSSSSIGSTAAVPRSILPSASSTASTNPSRSNIAGLTTAGTTRRGAPKTMDGVNRNLRGNTKNPVQQAVGRELHSLYTGGIGSTQPGGASARTKFMIGKKGGGKGSSTSSSSASGRTGSGAGSGGKDGKDSNGGVTGGTGKEGMRLGGEA